jgi:hypothetical protein
MLNTLVIFNNRQVKAIEVASTPNYPYISLDSLRQVEQYLTPDIEVVLKTKEGLVLLNCLDNEEDRQAVQNLLKQEKEEKEVSEKKDKRKEFKITESEVMSTSEVNLTIVSNDSYSQFFELASSMVSNIHREQELKELIIEKAALVEKLVEELKKHQEEFEIVKQVNSKFREFSQDTRLADTLQTLVKASEASEDEAE